MNDVNDGEESATSALRSLSYLGFQPLVAISQPRIIEQQYSPVCVTHIDTDVSYLPTNPANSETALAVSRFRHWESQLVGGNLSELLRYQESCSSLRRRVCIVTCPQKLSSPQD